jgi:subtilase family serine protease
MPVRFVAVMSALFAVLVMAAPPAPGQPGKHGGPPVFAAADHWDRSPALRDLPRRPPQRGSLREAPRFRRAIGPKSIDPVVQNAPAPQLIAPPSTSFEGVGNLDAVLPPDTNGAVGPNHYVQWVNLSFAVYARGVPGSTPTLIYGPAAGNTLWTGFGGPCESTNNGDPVVLYDELADRWVMTQLALPNSFFGLIYLPPFYQCIAVSATPDPTGAYYRYQYSFDKLNDYPKFGVWPDAYYLAINQFSAPSLTYAGQGVAAFDRAAMLAGRAAGMISFDLASVDLNLGGMLPSDLDGPAPPAGSPNVFMQIDDDAWGYAPDQLQLWRFHVDWTTPSNSTFTHAASLPVAPFDTNLCGGAENCVPQRGTTVALDTMSDRLMYRLQYRNFGDHESLVVNHTVDADGTDHAGIRWYEVRDPNGIPAIYQQGTYAPDADHRWMGSAAMDAAGNLAIGFSVSGLMTYPSIRYAARLAGDPLGTLAQGESTLIAGSGSQTNSTGRWGDYSMMSVDPVDGCTFWYTQQYYAATSDAGWQTRVGAFSVPPCTPPPPPGPTATIVATAATATEAGLTNGRFTVSRTGDTAAPMTVSYAVGGTATPGSDYEALAGSVTIPAGSTSATIAVVPLDDPLVESNETVVVTLTPGADYAIGSPAGALVTIVSDDNPPDLVLTAMTAPAVGGANATLTVSDTTKNQGTSPAVASTTTYVLSKDFVYSAEDILIGSRAVGALAPGASDSGSTALTVPAGTTTGTYYIVAKADGDGALPETNEGNNIKWSSIAIGPDLIVSALTAPATGAAGTALAITDTVTNRGGGDAPASSLAFYLSVNTTLDGGDIALGTRAVPALAGAATNSATTPVVIPAGTAPGAYYVIAAADTANAVTETMEANNTRVTTGLTRVGPDLSVSALTVPSNGGAGSALSVTDTTANLGAAEAPASKTAFYLSSNTTLDASDVLLAVRSAPLLAAGASSAVSTPITVPASTATGSYYVIANADYDAQISESNETNNVRVSALLRIGPDLTESGTTVSSTAAAGGTIVVGDTAKNQGAGDAGPSTTAFYLSTTSVFNASAVRIGQRPVPALAAGATNAASTPIALPANLATGNYYVFAGADGDSTVAETFETNNVSFGALVRVGPDLTVSSLGPPASFVTGVAATVNTTITNGGGGAAPATTVKFYLSTNLTVDASDIVVGSRAVATLLAGQSDAGPASILIPSGTAAGTYYLIAVADDGNVVVETNETNNTRLAAIVVSAQPAS